MVEPFGAAEQRPRLLETEHLVCDRDTAADAALEGLTVWLA
jgi:hypothetical protein